MTVAQFLAVFFVVFVGNSIMSAINGFNIDPGLLIAAIAALVESGIIAGVFWCVEHIRIV